MLRAHRYVLVLDVFEPEPVRVSDPLELLLDDGPEQGARPVVGLEHATHVEVDVVLKKTNDITDFVSTLSSCVALLRIN